MKISILLSIVLTVNLCAAVASSGSDEPVCLTEGCDGSREYCDGSIGECRAAQNDTECYNATTALFQDGCDAGHECIDDLCRVSADPVDGRTCKILCSAGKYCENGSTTCRGPSYDRECFNLATGFFEDGCDDGFYCSFNKCVDVSLEDEDDSTGSTTTTASSTSSTTTSGSALALDSSEMDATTASSRSSTTRSTNAWTSASMLMMLLPF